MVKAQHRDVHGSAGNNNGSSVRKSGGKPNRGNRREAEKQGGKGKPEAGAGIGRQRFAKSDRRKNNQKAFEDLTNRIKLELPKPGENWQPPKWLQAKNAAAGDSASSTTTPTTEGAGSSYSPSAKKPHALLSDNTFDQLPISVRTLAGLNHLKLTRMTWIQRGAIPHALAGRDIIGEAPTGSGKTMAYLIPVLECLYREGWSKMDGLGAMILVPTRELGQQVFDVLAKFKSHDFGVMACYGGKHIKKEQKMIRAGEILIGTPGRTRDHLDNTAGFSVDNLKVLVLDEADKLIERGFREDIQNILEQLPPAQQRQTLLFSATLSGAVRKLAKSCCRQDQEPEKVNVAALAETQAAAAPANLKHFYCLVNLEDKLNVLYSFLRQNFKKKVMVFVSTIKQCRLIYEAFKEFKTGARILEIHSGQDMGKRLEIFDEFSRRPVAITLVSTDLVGRGIDFPAVDFVVQLDCPPDIDTYIHRCGRTGRGVGASGTSVIFLNQSEAEFVKRIHEKKIDIKQVKIKPQAQHDITGKLQALCASSVDINHLALRAFQTYLKSQSLMADKPVFDFGAVAERAAAFAKSLGLAGTPQIDCVEETKAKDVKNVGGVLRNSQADDKNAKRKLSKLEALKQKIAERKKARKGKVDGIASQKQEMRVASDATSLRNEPTLVRDATGSAGDDFEVSEKIIANFSSDEENDIEEKKQVNLSKRERRMKKMQELRQAQSKPVIVEEMLTAVDDLETKRIEPEMNSLDWKTNPQVRQAIRKQRLVIRADGTVKIKGAAKMIPQSHIVFGDDDVPHDVTQFEGVLATLDKESEKRPGLEGDKEDGDSEQDEEVRGAETERERFLKKIEKRLAKTQAADKKRDRELRRTARNVKREKAAAAEQARHKQYDSEVEDLGWDEDGNRNKSEPLLTGSDLEGTGSDESSVEEVGRKQSRTEEEAVGNDSSTTKAHWSRHKPKARLREQAEEKDSANLATSRPAKKVRLEQVEDIEAKLLAAL